MPNCLFRESRIEAIRTWGGDEEMKGIIFGVMFVLLSIVSVGCGGISRIEPMVIPVSTPIKIMPLGDSITDGYNVPGGYRIDLWQHLLDRGHTIDFVGTQTNGPDALPDKEHQGHSGWRIDELQQGVAEWLRQTQPDLVLLVIGTNDIVQSYEIEEAPDRLDSLLDKIFQAAPDTRILVGSIPPIDQPLLNQRVEAYNQAVAERVRRRHDRGDRVLFVDLYAELTPNDLADGIHPNREGHRKIAKTWDTALTEILETP